MIGPRGGFEFRCLLLALFYYAITVSAGVARDTLPSRVALVIGNGAYKNAPELANPRNDAVDVAAALTDLGFDVITGLDLDRREMEKAIRAFSRKLAGSQLALVYYSGHGMQVDGNNYLVPIDATVERFEELDLDTIPLSTIQKQLEGSERASIIVLDACRDNPLSRSLASKIGPNRSLAVGQGLANVQGGVGPGGNAV